MHESPARDKPVEYAVDGVLHYAKHLAKHYTVLAVAVSGSTRSSMKVSNFLIPAGSQEVKDLVNESGALVHDILPYDDYYRLASFDTDVAKKRHADLLAFSKERHELIWTKAKISEEDKPLLVSGTLIALMNATFMKTFNAVQILGFLYRLLTFQEFISRTINPLIPLVALFRVTLFSKTAVLDCNPLQLEFATGDFIRFDGSQQCRHRSCVSPAVLLHTLALKHRMWHFSHQFCKSFFYSD